MFLLLTPVTRLIKRVISSDDSDRSWLSDYLFSQFLSQILSVSHFSIFSVHNFEVLNFYQKFLNPLAQGDFRRDHIIYIVRIKLEQ